MPDLNTCLYNRDLPFLRGVAAFWGLDITARDARNYSLKLEEAILNSGLIGEIIESLPKPALEALQWLRAADGSLPWTSFARVYGEIRPMGPAKFEREKPGVFPISTTELLWYRGLIGRTFYQLPDGLVENVFLPHEFMYAAPIPEEPAISPALSQVPGVPESDMWLDSAGSDNLLDQLCWLLSALRRSDRDVILAKWPLPNYPVLLELARAVGLVEKKNNLPTSLAKDFLEKPRAQAHTWLVDSWRASTRFDELRLVPDFRCEGTWQNNPAKPRRVILEMLRELPIGTWFGLETLIDHIGQYKPDFLRSGSEYDNWIIVSSQPAKGLLRGVSSWPEVEAVYLRFVLLGPMSWLGLLDQGSSKSGSGKSFIKRSALFDSLLDQYNPRQNPPKDEKIAIKSDGTIEMGPRSPRIARYQISRFGEWLEVSPKRYRFRLTPTSLKEARAQGLLTRHLLALLRKYAEPNPTLTQAILRWEEQGQEAWLDRPWVLHLANPELLKTLRDSPANKYLGEALGPTVVVVKPGGEAKVQGELVRLAILADGVEDADV
ncbi:MAG: hypothetical protein WBI14_05570 [Anaerolineaceae bacterium]